MDAISANEETIKKEVQIEFKKPVLFGRIGKLPKKVKTESQNPSQSDNNSFDDTSSLNVQEENKSTQEEKDRKSKSPKKSLSPAVLLKELHTPIPYKEPKWSGVCPDGSEYSLEVLKSGMIVDKIDLTSKAFYVFGRLANCEVILGHPTISRHHCILQYKAFANEGEPSCGWYLHDLGSTHGTFLNRLRLKPSHFTRVRVGHQIKFGNSSRTYILMGPDFDCEGESELSVTEIKKKALDMKLEREKMQQEKKEMKENERLEEERKREEQGIDWGMGEDAEEEPDLSENPFAATANEELYLDDPKKTLRGYFEREGHELNYDCEERGLPIDDARGRPLIAEAIHRGKKKEAVIACALEACRILDRAGLLRQAKHESRKKKQRDWSADDYYDSDEDTFLDRTGSVEKKRQQRMKKLGAMEESNSDKALTYDDLLKKVSDIEANIASEERTLEGLRSISKQESQTDGEADALDAFMTSLGKQGHTMAQKAEISKTKMAIQKLKAELSKTHRLAEIARPAHLPPLVKKDDSKMAVKMAGKSVVYGKRIRLKEDIDRKSKVRKEVKKEEAEFVEEMDSDDEAERISEDTVKIDESLHDGNINSSKVKETNRKSEMKEKDYKDSEMKVTDNTNGEKNQKASASDSKCDNSQADNNEKPIKEERVFGPMRPPENYVIPENYFDQETDRDLPEIMEDE
ncbi:hypothetical protein ACJJTC_019063 [Scirpophaga incertulas]